MRKVALVFVIAVIVPSILLAWLAVRSLRDQQFILERQQSLLYQALAEAKARDVQDILQAQLHAFTSTAIGLLSTNSAAKVQPSYAAQPNGFDLALRRAFPLARVGFVITLEGTILSPIPQSDLAARKFIDDNGRFLANRESAEVYWNPKQIAGNLAENQTLNQAAPPGSTAEMNVANTRSAQYRNVFPQQQADLPQVAFPPQQFEKQASKLASSQTEFRQLIGDSSEGALARFVDNQLSILFWCRPPENPQIICGAELSVPRLVATLRKPVEDLDSVIQQQVCLALLDDTARPVALSPQNFHANWKRPFVATEIGEMLPHWEMAVYLLNPEALPRTARAIKLTLGGLIAVLLLAIAVGSWLIVADLNRQLTLARQKTTFVSNVSHELKTPLTSIRMFSELLLEGRVTDPQKQRKYLRIITAETARLTRLINNVLDFARLERGEKKYRFQDCDLTQIVSDTLNTYRPHLEEAGFQLECDLPPRPLTVHADPDAISQVLLNLLSNAEKYSENHKEIEVRLESQADPVAHATLRISDRGLGVPRGSAEKIFEKFYRAHDALNSGIQGSGLGLTLARQIARAHGGEVLYEPRPGGGSTFSFHLPLLKTGSSIDSGTTPSPESSL